LISIQNERSKDFYKNHSKGFCKILPIYRLYKNIYAVDMIINSIMLAL